MNLPKTKGFFLVTIAVSLLMLTASGAWAQEPFPNWTDYFDGTVFLLEEQRTRVFADFEWDGFNHLVVNCDDRFEFVTASSATNVQGWTTRRNVLRTHAREHDQMIVRAQTVP